MSVVILGIEIFRKQSFKKNENRTMRTILSIAGMLVVMGAQAEVTEITPMQ